MAELKTTTINGNLTLTGYTTDILKYGTNNYNYALLGYSPQTGDMYATSFHAASDRRLKENIVPTDIDFKDILDKINIVNFNFKDDKEKKLNIGVIAQELRDILPEKYKESFISGHETEDDHLSVNETKLLYVALLALKDQEKRIAELEKKLGE